MLVIKSNTIRDMPPGYIKTFKITRKIINKVREEDYNEYFI